MKRNPFTLTAVLTLRVKGYWLLVVVLLMLNAQWSVVNAQLSRQEIYENIHRAGGNYLDYDYELPLPALTKTPKGYTPFYISHYGRHGSRWLLNDGQYMDQIKTLRKAEGYGKLTQKGREVLAKLEAFYPTTVKRLGDLTTVGERQHHGIGRRMTEHFPEVFKGNAEVDARSTVVIRCILSMEAECEELMAFNPKMKIHNDVSESFQYYLNAGTTGEVRRQGGSRERRDAESWSKNEYTHPERLSALLFNDPQYVTDSVNASSFMRHLFEVAINMQSHDTDIDFLDIFTKEEIYDLWRITNIGWYLGHGAAPQTGGVMPFSQSNLLKNILQTADTVVNKKNWNGATLRFGHEVCVLPLACLLELDSCGRQVSDLSKLDEQWVNYRIFPMACNIQLIFYRTKKGDGPVLIKALLNEKETTLPLPSDLHPYYRWEDFKRYYEKKLADFEAKYPLTDNPPTPSAGSGQASSLRQAQDKSGQGRQQTTDNRRRPMQTLYDFKVKDEVGKDITLSDYRGKLLLIVNTATRCGFTPQYKDLEALYQKFHSKGLEILDFPCNQFGAQAPGTIQEIHQFCTTNFDIHFPQFDKIDVNGENAHPLYVWLKRGNDIKWNFTKFLVSPEGRVLHRYEPADKNSLPLTAYSLKMGKIAYGLRLTA